jgi:hypothetical protein
LWFEFGQDFGGCVFGICRKHGVIGGEFGFTSDGGE